jgi:hypothetical protein
MGLRARTVRLAVRLLGAEEVRARQREGLQRERARRWLAGQARVSPCARGEAPRRRAATDRAERAPRGRRAQSPAVACPPLAPSPRAPPRTRRLHIRQPELLERALDQKNVGVLLAVPVHRHVVLHVRVVGVGHGAVRAAHTPHDVKKSREREPCFNKLVGGRSPQTGPGGIPEPTGLCHRHRPLAEQLRRLEQGGVRRELSMKTKPKTGTAPWPAAPRAPSSR